MGAGAGAADGGATGDGAIRRERGRCLDDLGLGCGLATRRRLAFDRGRFAGFARRTGRRGGFLAPRSGSGGSAGNAGGGVNGGFGGSLWQESGPVAIRRISGPSGSCNRRASASVTTGDVKYWFSR